MLSSSITLHKKPKDGEKGNDGVGVVSANVLFAVGKDKNDSSDIKDADWKDTFGQLALVKGKFVWSCTKTTYTKGNPSYTGKYCLGECYDFAEVTEMYALSDNGTNEPADGDKVWGESYVATKGKYLWTCERVVYTQNGVPSYLNKKCITYFAKDGEDALRVECNPKQLVFSVNENGQIINPSGNVFSDSEKSVFGLTVYKGETNVTNDATFSLSTPNGCNFTNTNDGAWLSYQKFNGFVWVYVSPNGIDRTSYKVGDANKDLPKTSSFVRATINYNGETTNVDIPLFVEFAAYNGDLENTIYGLNSHYESLSSKVDDQGAKIEENNSQIKQTAESVSTLVAKTDGLQKTTSSLQEQSDNISAKVEAVDKQGKTTQAELDMCVEKQKDGTYRSKMKMYADDLEFTAEHYMKIKSGQLEIESDNASLTKDGTLKTKNSEFENVKVSGSIRSDYAVVKSGMEELNVDNICIQSEDWFSFFQLKWTADQIGRTMRIANYTENGVIFTVPSSDVFFITNGQHVSSLAIAPNRCMVLHGFGFNGKFVAWCVENSYSYQASLPQYGMKYLSKGFVIYNSNSIMEIRQKTIGGSITVSRLSTGLYRMLLPASWSGVYASSAELLVYQIGVLLTGFGYSKDDKNKSSPIKATVKDINWVNIKGGQIYIDVWTSDDETVNDGDFQFLIYNQNTNFDE